MTNVRIPRSAPHFLRARLPPPPLLRLRPPPPPLRFRTPPPRTPRPACTALPGAASNPPPCHPPWSTPPAPAAALHPASPAVRSVTHLFESVVYALAWEWMPAPNAAECPALPLPPDPAGKRGLATPSTPSRMDLHRHTTVTDSQNCHRACQAAHNTEHCHSAVDCHRAVTEQSQSAPELAHDVREGRAVQRVLGPATPQQLGVRVQSCRRPGGHEASMVLQCRWLLQQECPRVSPAKVAVSGPGRRSRAGTSRRPPPSTRLMICGGRQEGVMARGDQGGSLRKQPRTI